MLKWSQPRISLTQHNVAVYFGVVDSRAASAPRVIGPTLNGPRMDHVPAFLEVRSDQQGLLWIRTVRAAADTLQEWYVVTNTGLGVARWLIPEATTDRTVVLVGRVAGRPVLYSEGLDGAPFLRAIAD